MSMLFMVHEICVCSSGAHGGWGVLIFFQRPLLNFSSFVWPTVRPGLNVANEGTSESSFSYLVWPPVGPGHYVTS